MKVFNDLKTPGVNDVLIAVTDGRKGIGEAQSIKVKWRELGWDKLIGEFAPREIGAELTEVEA